MYGNALEQLRQLNGILLARLKTRPVLAADFSSTRLTTSLFNSGFAFGKSLTQVPDGRRLWISLFSALARITALAIIFSVHATPAILFPIIY